MGWALSTVPIPEVELGVLAHSGVISPSHLAVYFALGGGCSLEAGPEPGIAGRGRLISSLRFLASLCFLPVLLSFAALDNFL